jgi:hypothetical protein
MLGLCWVRLHYNISAQGFPIPKPFTNRSTRFEKSTVKLNFLWRHVRGKQVTLQVIFVLRVLICLCRFHCSESKHDNTIVMAYEDRILIILHIFHIISQFNFGFFCIFHIFSLFNLAFFHIFHIISLFNLLFFHIFHIISLFNCYIRFTEF